MNGASPSASSGARPPEWGRMTWLRDAIARVLAGPIAAAPTSPAFACTIVKLDHLGDFVLALGAIRALVAHFGAERCALVISTEARALARREFPSVTQCVLPSSARGLFREIAPHRTAWGRELRRVAAQHVVCLRHPRSLYRDFVLRAIPAQRRWWLDAAPFGDRPILALPPAVARYPRDGATALELVAHEKVIQAVLGRPPQPILPSLQANAAETASTVVVAPFAAQGIRDFPEALLWTAVAALRERGLRQFVFAGSDAQSARLTHLVRRMPAGPGVDVSVSAGESLERWLQRLAGAALVLAADSASAHLATALDRPMVAVLGGGHPGIFAPWTRSSRQRWVRHVIPCYGCDWQCPFPEPYCLTQIDAAALVRAIDETLNAKVTA